jgi:hypothetical protein
VGTLTTTWKNSTAQALPDIVNNVTVFNVFNMQSGLSGIRPSLSDLENSLSQSLNAYAISQMLSELSLVVSRGANTDVNALQTNGTKLMWDTGCGSGYDSYGVCAEWYYDGTDSYAISNPDHNEHSYHDVLETFFNGSSPMTTGMLLFSDAYACAQSTGKNGGNSPSIDQLDPTSVSCLSSVGVCTWTMDTIGPSPTAPMTCRPAARSCRPSACQAASTRTRAGMMSPPSTSGAVFCRTGRACGPTSLRVTMWMFRESGYRRLGCEERWKDKGRGACSSLLGRNFLLMTNSYAY